MIQIKRWDNGELIHEADLPTLRDVVLDAVKKNIPLCSADLSYADLRSCDLRSCNLSSTDGIIPQMQSPLHMLLEQPAEIRAYKLVEDDYTGPYNGGIVYEVGKSVEVCDANTDIHESCGAGINIATLDWCLKEWVTGYRILVVEFKKEDIACIPIGTDGKFRVHRCEVVREVDLRAELNWPPEAEQTKEEL